MRLKGNRISTVVMLAALVASASLPAFATRVRRLSLQQVREQSESIVVGQVAGATTRAGETGKMVWTDYQVKVIETLSGEPRSGVMTVSFAGGEAGGLNVGLADVPQLEAGRTYLFFLQKSEGKHYPMPTVGWGQGLFRLETATIDGAKKNFFVSLDGEPLQMRDGKLARGAHIEIENGSVVTARQFSADAPEPTRMSSPTVLNGDGSAAPAPIQLRSTSPAQPQQRVFATLDQVRDFVHGKLEAEQPRPRTLVR